MKAASLLASLLLGAGGPAMAQANAAAPTSQPALSLPQQSALRCSAAFALGAEAQARGEPQAQGWPPLAARGREYFVRSAAQLMDETGMTRDAIAALLGEEAQRLRASGDLLLVMPSCLLLLDASGV